jgi:hypothetical protein
MRRVVSALIALGTSDDSSDDNKSALGETAYEAEVQLINAARGTLKMHQLPIERIG